ncbi:MAG: 50S ribosomal protein L13 [Patescibacteria group bacterium]|nr:MAG: 50S ribosomal protein L13 [Patescibacteria group bacterium]
MQKTYTQKASEVKRTWHLVDAKDKVLGRVATDIATKLIGKNKKEYTPHIDSGDFVVVINAKEVAVTGTKEQDKMYYRHSNFPGGLKSQNLAKARLLNPEVIIENAVRNMLPKNKLQDQRMTRLKVYAGSEHKHESQLGASK